MLVVKRFRYLSLVFIGGLASVDLITKTVVRAALPPGLRLELFSGLINVANYTNPGKILGIFDDYFSIFFTAGVIILVYLLFMHIFSSPSYWLVSAECSIFGGAVGNVVDKLADGMVTDFISIGLPLIRNLAFNLADVFIIFGALAALPLGLFDIFGKREITTERTGVDS
ncbi:MAG: signal peptidase II [Candidatus Coatesbacteria bacterium]|nr:MAG: signal peptidase II [Candidatus Coatesbacteria bacterium]